MMVVVDVELLLVPNCPHGHDAAGLMRAVLDAAGVPDVPVRVTVIETVEEAVERGFVGSPTFLVDGVDPFAATDPVVPALACRLYRTAGGLRGIPDREDLLGAVRRAAGQQKDLGGVQRAHWQQTYTEHPGMYGENPSAPAVYAAELFRSHGASDVLELGAGHGRDALFLARSGFTVTAADFSAEGLGQLRDAAAAQGIADRVTTLVHDAREPLPVATGSIDAVFAHMLLCMALSTNEIHALLAEIRRVLRPGGILVYTVRHTGDAHYGTGISYGDDIYEHGGFAVHFFPRRLVDELAQGWQLIEVHPFEEGELPRRLWRVTQTTVRP